MNSAATLPSRSLRAAGDLPRPVVLIDGVPESRLTVIDYTADAPLDTRSVTLDANVALLRPSLRRRWQHAHALVALPMRLADEQVRWHVLADGVIAGGERTSSPGREQRRLTLHDAWSARLERPLERIWWARGDRALVANTAGRMQPGTPGNRSHEPFRFAGHDVFVLQDAGQAWTLATALATLSAWAELELSLTLLSRDLARAPLTQPIDLTAPLGDVMRRLLEPYNLVIQRDTTREADTLITRRTIRPTAHGRLVRLPAAHADQPVGHLLSLTGDETAAAAQPWVARAAGWRIESTFDLVPGWHPDTEGAADTQYGRTTSSDFAHYANAYRYWVLNGDGRFTEPPYSRGPAFDLAAFFGDGDLRPQALPLRPCLTLDDAGELRPPRVEVSTDAGDTWSQYPGPVRLTEHRAAIYFDDDTLPTSFLAAAQQGDARVRVTASLQSPHPVETLRWHGNPFAGTRPPRVFTLDEAFRFERVATTSIHHAAVEAGTLHARQSDPHREMRQWLVDRLREHAAHRPDDISQSRCTFSGAWLTLQPGDRLQLPSEADDAASATRPPTVIRRVRCRLDRATTELDLRA